MSELKRYDPSCDDVTIGSMDEELEGDYVEYADYARLKAAAEQMRQTLDDLFVYEMPSKMEGPTAVRWNQIEAALAAYQEATR